MNRTSRFLRAPAVVIVAGGLLVACGTDDRRTAPAPRPTPVVASSATATTAVVASSAPATTVAPQDASTGALQARLDALVASGVPGVVGLRRDGDRTEVAAAGLADVATGTPVTVDTVFRTGSVAKTFVATVMLQLSDEGLLTLDDTVEQWLPGLVPNGGAITIRHLLGNRSGLFDFAADPQVLAPYLAGDLDHVWTPEQLVAVATAHAPNFGPGEASLYSNTDYTLAGMIIERATAHTVAAEVAERVSEPLGLHHTSLPTSSELPTPYAHGYAVDLAMQDVTAVNPSVSSFGGNLVSTAGDLAVFFDALFSGRLVPPDLLAEMEATTTSAVGERLGLGLQQIDLPCGTFIGHSGSTPGYKAAAFSDPAHDRQFVMIVNSVTQQDQVGDDTAAAAFDAAAVEAACGA